MLIVRAVCTAKDGQEAQARSAALDLMEQARDHTGLQAYFWSADETGRELVVTEVHENPASLVHHIEHSDLSQMEASMTITQVDTYGDTPPADLQAALSGFAEYKHYAHV
jgi:quinol monooxygenase YgiN